MLFGSLPTAPTAIDARMGPVALMLFGKCCLREMVREPMRLVAV